MHDLKLISLYYKVCELYNSTLQYNVQRFSNNGNKGNITDEELITMHLFAQIYEQKHEKKQVYDYIKNHWLAWFPTLPSYPTFCNRLNNLTGAYEHFIIHIFDSLFPSTQQELHIILGDSMPIITCSGKRKNKVATHICDKSYCASKSVWYQGVKLHLLADRRKGTLPMTVYIKITPASVHDLTAVREAIKKEENTIFVLDKAYCDEKLSKELHKKNSCLFTPEKGKKNTPKTLKQMDFAFKKQLNTAVAKIRQPIESAFNWIHQKTNIQNAAKIRSEKGLWLHIFSKLTAAFIILTEF
ncbi:transposase [Bernardetia sp. OM2101]|uniref:transposase n=1 Tax=Bernardetia sp. OM2101 TaxID=3344876 RepID=UPI0035CFB890